MFYATPDQKANTSMYAGYYANGVGPNQPTARQIQNSANREQVYRNVMGSGVIAAATGGVLIAGAPVAAAVSTVGYSVIGAVTGGGTDAAAQFAQSGTIRPEEAVFAAATGAISGSIGARVGYFNNMVLGATGSGVNTEFNNIFYGESKNVISSLIFGAMAGVGGNFIGAATKAGLASVTRPYIYKKLDLTVPVLLQPRTMNPVPGLSGAAVGGIAGGMSSFVPEKEVEK
jgi:filamentous hemagglutinin